MKARWSKRRVEAAINAVTSMLAGEEGEGDWDPAIKAADLEGALAALIAMRDRRKS